MAYRKQAYIMIQYGRNTNCPSTLTKVSCVEFQDNMFNGLGADTRSQTDRGTDKTSAHGALSSL